MEQNTCCCENPSYEESGCGCGSGKEIKIDYLYLDLNTCDRCIGTVAVLDEVLDTLRPTLELAGYQVLCQKREISNAELAEKYHFRSSPTILVNGQDIFGAVIESDCGCCGEIAGTQVDCRVFEHEGITREVPTKKMLTDAILKAVYHPTKCCCEEYQLPENLKRFFEGKEGKGKKKLYVLTGFLGAGKTSLLLHLLDNLEGRKVGVIQNEFGKLSIDGALVNRNGIQMTEISRGSIFCSCLKGAFAQALAEMGKMNLEYVFVESSGLADPSNIEEILGEVTAMAGEVYDFKGVICLIDGVNFLEQLSDVETVDRQLAHCHMAVINKMDLIDDAQLAKVTDAIRQVNPICHVITSRFGLIDLDFLDMDLSALQWAPCEDSHNTVDNKPKTISLESEAVLSREVLAAFLQAVLPDCYRIKGFFRLEEGWQQVDVVEKLIDFKPCQERELSQLVFLSKIGPKVIRTVDGAWKEIVKQPMKLKN